MNSVTLSDRAGAEAGSGELMIGGSLTLDHAEAVLRFLREAVGKYTDLRVSVEDATGLDLGFLQLLEALRAHQQSRGAKLEVSMSLEPELAALLRSTGFAHWVAQSDMV